MKDQHCTNSALFQYREPFRAHRKRSVPSRFVAIWFALFIGLWIWPSASQAKLHFGPYLQSVENGTVEICAHFDKTDKARVVLIGDDEKEQNLSFEGHEPACARVKELTPDIEYPYQLFINDKPIFDNPKPAFVSSTDTNHTFVIFGDTRSGDDSFDVSHREIVRTIRAFTLPDAVIHTGDFVEEGERFELWENFFHIEADLLRTTILFPAIGRSDQPAQWMRKLFPALKKSPWYSFDRGLVHFSVLKIWQDYSQPEEEVGPDSPQLQWLRADLANARKSGSKYLFVVLHQPIYDIDGQTPAVAKELLMPLFEHSGVTAVFSGAHFFSHIETNGVHYFTNGGGGAVLEKRLPPENIFRFFSAIHHYLQLEVGYFGARVKAIDSQGDEFYLVDLDKKEGSTRTLSDASTVHDFAPLSSNTPPVTISFTVFFDGKKEQKEKLFTFLAETAQKTNKKLVVTFRSVLTSSDRAALAAFEKDKTHLPVAIIGNHILDGWTVLRSGLPDALETTARSAEEQDIDAMHRLLVLGVILAGLMVLISTFVVVFRRKKRQRS